ncbi:hypothetical protein F4778DRAFT_763287 [Xylariomycetidae sp. FL2044]|nr:hypothetical protein F4778DRAFT_763287 [Xylariomycetidae sp. FL2044]
MPRVAGSYHNRQPRPKPRSHLAGCISWLPHRQDLSMDAVADEGWYNHPVVILSPQPEDGKVIILMLTSFGGQDLAVRHDRPRMRLRYLPIEGGMDVTWERKQPQES